MVDKARQKRSLLSCSLASTCLQKINQKNTWDLELIDHISHIVKADSRENNSQTNFQKVRKGGPAACILPLFTMASTVPVAISSTHLVLPMTSCCSVLVMAFGLAGKLHP